MRVGFESATKSRKPKAERGKPRKNPNPIWAKVRTVNGRVNVEMMDFCVFIGVGNRERRRRFDLCCSFKNSPVKFETCRVDRPPRPSPILKIFLIFLIFINFYI